MENVDYFLTWMQLLCALLCQVFNCYGEMAYYPLWYNETGFPLYYLVSYFSTKWPEILLETFLYLAMIGIQISLVKKGVLTKKRVMWALGFPVLYVLYTVVFTKSFACFTALTWLVLVGPVAAYVGILALRIQLQYQYHKP
ncbi:hypothetical protein [Siphonobacter sp. SORGH_AS_0500]|uniref:hypothetical protein n=1 Tax=Siphonobacter sp. SORGH_AS_0500 TaxID=1864824 RepID=UPI00285E9F17|nr:hypothetical protein [Siphonobacter sp. SORGH_AS_0500]MDR6197052.1 hypothetical protein [Siphonobacter sp. SORGH_AS_0500]